jgi:hypothetical protein
MTTDPNPPEVHNWYVSQKFDIQTYLKERVHGQLAYFNRKSSLEKDKFMRLQWTLIVGSALTPLLGSAAALCKMSEKLVVVENIFLVLALASASVVGIVANALKTFKSQENWLNNRTTCEMLHREKFLFEAGVPPYDKPETREKIFVKQVEDMLAREQNQWLSVSQTNLSESDTKS